MMHFNLLILTLFLFIITKCHCESSDPVSSAEEEDKESYNTTIYGDDEVFRTRRMFKTTVGAAQKATQTLGKNSIGRLETVLQSPARSQVNLTRFVSTIPKPHSNPFGTQNDALSQHTMNLLRENAGLKEKVHAANQRAHRLDKMANSWAQYAMEAKLAAQEAEKAAAKGGSQAGSFAFGTVTGSALMALAFMASFAEPEPRVTVTKPGETSPIIAQATNGGNNAVVPQTTVSTGEQKKPESEAKTDVDDFPLKSDAIFKSIRERAPEEKEVAKAIGASYKFVLSDGSSHKKSWLVDLTGEIPVVTENSIKGADLVVTTTDETFMEIVTRKITPIQAVKQGKMKYEGGFFNAVKYGALLRKALDPNNENGFKLDVPQNSDATASQ